MTWGRLIRPARGRLGPGPPKHSKEHAMNTMQELQRRLDTLEHEVIRGRQDARRYRTVCFGLPGAIVAGVCLAAAASQIVHDVI